MTQRKQESASDALFQMLAEARNGERTLIMGVLNVTPDSFSDGGQYASVNAAVNHAEALILAGADILDIGGESTRPATFQSSQPLSVEDELARILPVIVEVTNRWPEIPVSVDTYKAMVARASLEAGAVIINDISGLRADSQMASVVAEAEAVACIMHMAGLPMMVDPHPVYIDIASEIRDHLVCQTRVAESAGIPLAHIVHDPGIGFGKTVEHNLEIMRRLAEIITPGIPMLVGPSRKSFIGAVLDNAGPEDRLEGTAAAVSLAIAGGASIVRVHDVVQMRRVVRMTDAIVRGWTAQK